MMPVDLPHLLDLIKGELQFGSFPSDPDNLKFVMQIVESFHEVWRMCNEYRQLGSKVDEKLFRDIFEDMSLKFCQPDLKITFTCQGCGIEFPLMNNDAELTFQLHQQTSEHIAAMQNDIEESSSTDGAASHSSAESHQHDSFSTDTGISTTTSNNHSRSPLSSDSGFSNSAIETRYIDRPSMFDTSVGEVDRWIRMRKDKKYCTLCDVILLNECHLRHHVTGLRHREDDEWISRRGTRYSCDLCDISSIYLDEFKQHINGLEHEKEIWIILKYFNFISSETMIDATMTSVLEQIYESDPRIRLIYFFNKACIVRLPHSTHHVCGLCKTDLGDGGQIMNHLFDATHTTKLDELLETCDDSVSFEVGVICDANGLDYKCYLCDVYFCSFELENHVRKQYHQKRTKIHFDSPRFKKWEKGIILREGLPYCVLCQLCLGDQFSMRIHVNDAVHINKLASAGRL